MRDSIESSRFARFNENKIVQYKREMAKVASSTGLTLPMDTIGPSDEGRYITEMGFSNLRSI